jgi:tRNA pseudouridine38-40 synthase
MTQNIFLELEYDGTDFFGWQIQASTSNANALPTVQGLLQQALAKLFNEQVKINYASRTDRGVHACGQCVNFKINTNIALTNIKRAVNGFLPSGIRIKKIKKVSNNFHSRFDARYKWYRYILATNKISVFQRHYRGYIPVNLNYQKIKSVLSCLRGEHDFSRLAHGAANYRNPCRNIYRAEAKKRGAVFYFDIKANGFMRYMVRNIITLLVEVGSGKITKTEACKIINNRRTYKKHPAPPQGLYLMKVYYEKS